MAKAQVKPNPVAKQPIKQVGKSPINAVVSGNQIIQPGGPSASDVLHHMAGHDFDMSFGGPSDIGGGPDPFSDYDPFSDFDPFGGMIYGVPENVKALWARKKGKKLDKPKKV